MVNSARAHGLQGKVEDFGLALPGRGRLRGGSISSLQLHEGAVGKRMDKLFLVVADV